MQLPYSVLSENTAMTEACGEQFARQLLRAHRAGTADFIAMYGDLGAGKTAFVRGAARVLAPASHVQSPTYTVVNEYRGTPCTVVHMDAYRLQQEDDLYSVGFYDYFERDCFLFAEWSENLGDALPQSRYEVRIDKCEKDDQRRLTITAVGQ